MCNCEELQTIQKACGNRGTAKDVKRAWWICEDEIESIPAHSNGTISADIVLKDGATWKEIGIDPVGSSYNWGPQGEGYSQEFLNTATLFINGTDPLVSLILSGRIHSGHALIIQDKNGNRWLYGEPSDGAQIAPTGQNDRNGYSVVASWPATHMPYGYTGLIEVEEP